MLPVAGPHSRFASFLAKASLLYGNVLCFFSLVSLHKAVAGEPRGYARTALVVGSKLFSGSCDVFLL
jgi:hypothetical protein